MHNSRHFQIYGFATVTLEKNCFFPPKWDGRRSLMLGFLFFFLSLRRLDSCSHAKSAMDAGQTVSAIDPCEPKGWSFAISTPPKSRLPRGFAGSAGHHPVTNNKCTHRRIEILLWSRIQGVFKRKLKDTDSCTCLNPTFRHFDHR